MKFGVVIHKPTMNLGDDIQTYAAAKLLPHVDYQIDREYISDFKSENDEPVAVIMNAWWMWKKWNWPPADCIIPKLLSMHINNYGVARKSSPIYAEWAQGCGGEFFKKYGPVGCRDMASLDFFKEQGIDCYFSGCLTLTIPKQEKTEDAGTYVCLVDLNDKIRAKAMEYLKDTGLEIRVISHNCDYRKSNATFEERMAKAEEILTLYQNAKFVITRRLHVTLPCLALETPVLSIVDLKDAEGNGTRWGCYMDTVRCIDNEDFLSGNFEYDFNNPPENKKGYLALREKLIQDVQDFVAEYENCDLPLEQVRKTTYTPLERLEWQNNMKTEVLEKWLKKSRKLLDDKKLFEKKYKDTLKNLRKYKKYVGELLVKLSFLMWRIHRNQSSNCSEMLSKIKFGRKLKKCFDYKKQMVYLKDSNAICFCYDSVVVL